MISLRSSRLLAGVVILLVGLAGIAIGAATDRAVEHRRMLAIVVGGRVPKGPPPEARRWVLSRLQSGNSISPRLSMRRWTRCSPGAKRTSARSCSRCVPDSRPSPSELGAISRPRSRRTNRSALPKCGSTPGRPPRAPTERERLSDRRGAGTPPATHSRRATRTMLRMSTPRWWAGRRRRDRARSAGG